MINAEMCVLESSYRPTAYWLVASWSPSSILLVYCSLTSLKSGFQPGFEQKMFEIRYRPTCLLNGCRIRTPLDIWYWRLGDLLNTCMVENLVFSRFWAR